MSFRNSRRHSKSGRSTRNHYAGHKKTELCRDHLNGTCERGPECSFAHGVDELKPRVLEVGNYKTEKCDMWASRLHLPVEKRCQYGTRCHFLHDEYAWAQKGDTTVLYSESEEMYRIIRKVSNSGSRSRRHRRGGPCDEVRSCSAALMPESELDKYRSFTLPLKPTLDEEKSSSVIVSDLESGIHSEHSSVAPLMDEDESEFGDTNTPSTTFGSPGTFSQTSSVLCDTDVESVVSTHVSSAYSSTASSQRSIDLQPSTVSCHLPSNVSTVTPYPDQSVYGGSLLRMTSVSQKRAQLTVEIPEPDTTIFGTPDSPTSPQVISIGINTQQTRTPSPPIVTQTIPPQPQPQTQVQAPIVQCIPQQRMPQVMIQNTQAPMQIAHTLSSPQQTAPATAYVVTYMQVGLPDGTTQILPVLSPVGSNARPAQLTSSQSAPPSPPQAIGQYVQTIPQQQTVFQLPTQPIMSQQPRVCSVMVPACSSPQQVSQPVHLSSPQSVQTPTILPSPISVSESGIVA